MTSVLTTAPAKVNLTLDVLSRRDDGYHDIASVFLALTLADTLTVERTHEGIDVSCEGFDAPAGEDNIAYKAAMHGLNEFGLAGGCRIHIQKRIPIGAGLGGGSSDGAAVVNRLADEAKIADRNRRRAIAARLGSDVPFFIDGGCAIATGRGEILAPLPIPASIPIVLICTGESVSTAWAYAQIAPSRLKYNECATARAVELIRCGASWRDIAAHLSNDFEGVVLPARSDIADAKQFLIENGAVGVLMTGSGAAVFGVFEDLDHACAVADVARVNFGWAVATETAKG